MHQVDDQLVRDVDFLFVRRASHMKAINPFVINVTERVAELHVDLGISSVKIYLVNLIVVFISLGKGIQVMRVRHESSPDPSDSIREVITLYKVRVESIQNENSFVSSCITEVRPVEAISSIVFIFVSSKVCCLIQFLASFIDTSSFININDIKRQIITNSTERLENFFTALNIVGDTHVKHGEKTWLETLLT
jgi:hypothetical protein